MEKIDLYKKTKAKFMFGELVTFLAQTFTFFVVSIFASNFLHDQSALEQFANQRINADSGAELIKTFLAIFVTLGILSGVARVSSSKFINEIIDEMLFEIPRVVYFFGSSGGGVAFAIAAYFMLHPGSPNYGARFMILALLFSAANFAYGCFFSYWLKKKTHIIGSVSESPASA